MWKPSHYPHVLIYHPVSAPQVPCRSTWIRVMPSTCRRSDDESCTKIPFLLFSIDRSDVVDNWNIYHIISVRWWFIIFTLYLGKSSLWISLQGLCSVMIDVDRTWWRKGAVPPFSEPPYRENTWSSKNTSLRLQWITNGIHLRRVVPGHRQNRYISFKCIMRAAALMTLLLVFLM